MTKVDIVARRIIFDGFIRLESITFQRKRFDGRSVTLEREVADAGDAAVILPYDRERGVVMLIRQFRCIAHLKEGGDGLVIEAIAGKLDGQSPESCARQEAEEEGGVRFSQPLEHVFDAYSTPGSYAEKLSFFIAPYSSSDVVSAGGGLEHEEEDIEVLELPFEQSLEMIKNGKIVDTKTIALLYHLKVANVIDR